MIRDSSKIYGEVNDPNTVLASGILTNDKLIVGAGNKGVKTYAPGSKKLLITDDDGDITTVNYGIANKLVMTDAYGDLMLGDIPEGGDCELIGEIIETIKASENVTKNNVVGVYEIGDEPISVAVSPNGEFVAVTHADEPYVKIYSIDGSTFTRLPDPNDLPPFIAQSCAFSPDGKFLVIGHNGSPLITIYSINGVTFTKLQDPLNLPTGTAYGCAFSPNSDFLAIAHYSSPYLTIYSITGTTFTKLPDLDNLPTGNARDCTFSPDGKFLVIGHNTAPFITIYEINGTTFSKLQDPVDLPTGIVNGCVFNVNSTFLAVAHTGSPYLTIYSITGTTFTKLPDLDNLPNGTALGCAFSPNDNHLVVSSTNPPYLIVYDKNGATFTKSENIFQIPFSFSTRDCKFTTDGMKLIVLSEGNKTAFANHISLANVYSTGGAIVSTLGDITEFYEKSNTHKPYYIKIGYAKEDISENEEGNIAIIMQ